MKYKYVIHFGNVGATQGFNTMKEGTQLMSELLKIYTEIRIVKTPSERLLKQRLKSIN